MANILYLIHKKRFDLSLALYLRNFHKVFLITSEPMIGLFLDVQGENNVKLYKLNPFEKDKIVEEHHKDALKETEVYNTCRDPKIIHNLKQLCINYMEFMDRFLEKHNINLVITNDLPFLDVACISRVSIQNNIPVCYMGSGFFRGKTITVSLERLNLEHPEIWSKRLSSASTRPVIDTKSLLIPPYSLKPFKNPTVFFSLFQKLRYQRNPFWTSIHPDMKPPRTLMKDIRHKAKKKKARKAKINAKITIPEPFVLLPLQGNEICRQVANPLGIRDMEHLTLLIIEAISLINRSSYTRLHLIAKEHPNRPEVISPEFKKLHPEPTYLTKYPIEPLIEKADLICTFNSLAGFEALLKLKSVVTLGPAFYAQRGLAFNVTNINNIANIMKTAIETGTNGEAVDSFVSFLKKNYEIECRDFSRKKISVEGLHKIACRIAGILDFNRSGSASKSAPIVSERKVRSDTILNV